MKSFGTFEINIINRAVLLREEFRLSELKAIDLLKAEWGGSLLTWDSSSNTIHIGLGGESFKQSNQYIIELIDFVYLLKYLEDENAIFVIRGESNEHNTENIHQGGDGTSLEIPLSPNYGSIIPLINSYYTSTIIPTQALIILEKKNYIDSNELFRTSILNELSRMSNYALSTLLILILSILFLLTLSKCATIRHQENNKFRKIELILHQSLNNCSKFISTRY